MTLSANRSLLRALVAASAMTAIGCADNSASVEIRHLSLAQANPSLPGSCSVSADPSASKLLGSVLDIALRDNYVAYPLIQNNLFQSRSGELNRPDQRAIQAQYVDVELTTLGGALLSLAGPSGTVPSSYRVPMASDLIPAGTTATPGYGNASLTVLTSAQVAALRERLGCTGFATGSPPPAAFCARQSETITVTLRPTYRTLGGLELTASAQATWRNASAYTFPLTVCCGCLLNIPSGFNAACQSTTMGTTTTMTQGYCIGGQDFPTDCTTCAGQPQCSRSGC